MSYAADAVGTTFYVVVKKYNKWYFSHFVLFVAKHWNVLLLSELVISIAHGAKEAGLLNIQVWLKQRHDVWPES
jgi:hypothetical protein